MSEYFLRTLFVHTPGTRLVLQGDAVRALRDDMPPRRLPLNAIDSIVVLGGVEVSTPLIVRCAEDGRTVAFLSRYGKPRAVVEGPFVGRGQLRQLQHGLHAAADKRASVARVLVAGKIRQMAWGLRQWARDAKEPEAQRLIKVATDVEADIARLEGVHREAALGIEGIATRRYYQGVAIALKASEFAGRNRRPPTDPVNAVLSFLYGMTRVAVHGATHAAGLDPYCGFLHGDKDSQPSLVLDLMEEFRPSADRLAVVLLNRRQLRQEHFARSVSGATSLTDTGREIVMDNWHQHRMRQAHVKSARLTIPNAALPIMQANSFANALRSGTAYYCHELVIR